MGEFGQVVVAPGVGNIKTAFADRGIPFTHDQETATPYYYKVTMNAENGHNITAETTATSRVGSIRFSFDEGSSPHVIVDATREHITGEITVSTKRREIYGRNPERQDYKLGPFKAKNFNGYFVARFDQPFSSWGTIANGKLYENKTNMVSTGLSAYVKFQEKKSQVNVRVGTSFISIEQARKNLENEIPDGTTLEETSRQVESLWAEKLDRVNIEGASQDKLIILYTGMFHSLQVKKEFNNIIRQAANVQKDQ
jgi:putative alpha-1,2-mannosidase